MEFGLGAGEYPDRNLMNGIQTFMVGSISSSDSIIRLQMKMEKVNIEMRVQVEVDM